MIKLGVTSLTFKQNTPEEIVEIVKGSSAVGIEWGENENHAPLGDLPRADEIKELTLSNGLEVFSFGSYYKLGEPIEKFERTLQTALSLDSPVIRIWAGGKSPNILLESDFDDYVSQAKIIGDIAKENNISVCFEYHNNTLTENANSAKRLMDAVNHPNVGLYWQPNFDYDFAENLAGLKSIVGHVTKNIHINNHSADAGYKSLSEIKDDLNGYFKVISQQNRDFNIIVEFVKGGAVQNFCDDLKVLKKVALENRI